MKAAASTQVLDLVVVDDVCRFPLHVWRHLAGSFAFGIGDLGAKEGEEIFEDKGQPSGLPTPSGRARVWWVNAGGSTWTARLETILGKTSRPRRFLLDVRGPSPKAKRKSGYELRKALDLLASHGVKIESETMESETGEVLLVSSYEMIPPAWDHPESGGPVYFQVHPKAGETLDLVRRWVQEVAEPQKPPSRSSGRKPRPACRHVLVTGAGFELAATTPPHLRHPGIPRTPELVNLTLKGESHPGREPTYPPGTSEDSEPTPFQVYEDQVALGGKQGSPHPLLEAARSADLDDYWNQLLQLELEWAAREESDAEGIASAKHAASRREHHLREAFRGRFLRDDWGFLPQAVMAARMPWLAWLSTNYTRFADRAIDLGRTSPPTDKEPPAGKERPERWRIVSTSNEATHLIRELLHRRGDDEAARAAKGTSEGRPDRPRYLFKLHGDVSHLTTMAIAGHDKDLYSPLSFPVDSLHHVYTAAELFLERTLDRAGAPVVWHLVGHGLKDRLLVELLARVVRRSRGRHLLVLVAPKSEGEPPPEELLERVLGAGATDRGKGDEVRCMRIHSPAAGYMEWLAEKMPDGGEPPYRPTSFEDWEEELSR